VRIPKNTSHNSSHCRILQNLKTNKNLLTELIAPSQLEDTEEVPLENPTEVDPSLILIIEEDLNTSTQPLFSNNSQIKNALDLLIMDNGSQKNLVSQSLVNLLNLVTTPHLQPYRLGWVQKDGPRLLVSKCCLVTFAIGQFKDIVLYDVSHLDCADLLLSIPYQTQSNAIYLAKSRLYKITKEGHTYILTAAKLKPPSTKEKIPHVNLNQSVSLCLVHPITLNNTMHPILEIDTPLLHEFAEVFQPPEGLPPSFHIDHSIHLIPISALPNTPTYQLAPIEIEEMERQLTDLINSGHIQPSTSSCASISFVIPK
jgi:hypothetical protein